MLKTFILKMRSQMNYFPNYGPIAHCTYLPVLLSFVHLVFKQLSLMPFIQVLTNTFYGIIDCCSFAVMPHPHFWSVVVDHQCGKKILMCSLYWWSDFAHLIDCTKILMDQMYTALWGYTCIGYTFMSSCLNTNIDYLTDYDPELTLRLLVMVKEDFPWILFSARSASDFMSFV